MTHPIKQSIGNMLVVLPVFSIVVSSGVSQHVAELQQFGLERHTRINTPGVVAVVYLTVVAVSFAWLVAACIWSGIKDHNQTERNQNGRSQGVVADV